MFHNISERIIAYAVGNNILDDDKTDEYIYGLELSLSVGLSYISVIIIGIMMGMIWQAALFLLIFVSVRRFAGGFHFASQIACYLCTCLICTSALLTIKYTGNGVFAWSAAMALSMSAMLLLSPIPAVEKPLDEKEKIVYGKIARIILAVIAGVYIVLCFLQNMYAAKIICVTMITVAILAIVGKVKYRLYQRKRTAS